MSKLEKYLAYKDSGVEWLGEVPREWEVKKLKYIVKEHNGNGFPINEQGSNNEKTPFFKVSDINGKNIYISHANNYVSDNTIKNMKWNLIPCGSIVTAKIGEALRKNHRKIINVPSIIDNNCIAFEPKKIETKFNYYLHKTIDFDWFSNVGAVPSISVARYKNFKVSIPPKPEQIKIASFLDNKTQQLDKAIKQKEQLIELLKERRQILINDAVTRGIDKTVNFKDSGVEWIGEIPTHWEVRRLASIGRFSKGGGIARDNLINDGIPTILYGDIYTKYNYKTDITKNFISKDTVKNAIKIVKGKILLTGSGETKEDIGKCIVYTGEVDAYAGGDIIIFNQNKEDSLFLGYSLNSSNSISQKMMMAKGEIIVHIYGSKLKELIIPLPSTKQEQEDIVNYIEENNQKIDKAIDLQQQQITKLKEYKTTLIDSVVTGKVKIV